MKSLRVTAIALLCTLFGVSAAAAGQGVGASAHAGGGAHGGGGGHLSSGAAQSKSPRVTRYDNPGVLHYLEPSSGFAFARYDGCGTARAKPGCAPTPSVQLLSLRDQGLRLQQADGGTLTLEDRAELQSKLDSILTAAK
jgi:hypothetical protein